MVDSNEKPKENQGGNEKPSKESRDFSSRYEKAVRFLNSSDDEKNRLIQEEAKEIAGKRVD